MTSSQPVSEEGGSSGLSETGRDVRLKDVESKHRLVAEFLREHRFDALLLQRPENFAWFTAGADNTRNTRTETVAALFITPEARVVVTNNVDAVQLFEHDLTGLGFQLKQRAWHESHTLLLQDVCRGRTVASDSGSFGTRRVSAHLQEMRLPVTDLETARLRELGRRLVHSVEATARNCRRNQTEAELAAEVSHRLIKRRVLPARIQVLGDGRGERFRHWSYGKEPVRSYATICVTGMWHGLHLGVARTFCFDEAPPVLREAHNKCALMLATGMAFSQHNWTLAEVWKRVRRIYEKFDVPDEWQLARQAEVTGYQMTEAPLVPHSEYVLQAGMPICWHPSVGPALAAESLLVSAKGFEWLTPLERWPQLTVTVKGRSIHCPDILVLKESAVRPDRQQDFTMMPGDSFLGPVTDESGSEYDLTAVVVD